MVSETEVAQEETEEPSVEEGSHSFSFAYNDNKSILCNELACAELLQTKVHGSRELKPVQEFNDLGSFQRLCRGLVLVNVFLFFLTLVLHNMFSYADTIWVYETDLETGRQKKRGIVPTY